MTCCLSCNSRRQDTPLADWLARELGDDAAATAQWIVEHTALDLRPYRAQAKALLAARRA